jgi:hypothetical protein
MQTHPESSFLSLLPLLLLSLCMGIASFLLAKDKGRNPVKWAILGSIPIVNFACVWYFIGASNVRVERKIDDLIARLNATVKP